MTYLTQLATKPDAFLALLRALLELDGEGQHPVCEDSPEQWFSSSPAERATAAEACAFCPCLAACAAYANTAGEKFGVWGGTDRTDRRGAGR